MRLHGKIALLTGAAAATKGNLMGFGGAAAHLFVREGAKLVLTDRYYVATSNPQRTN